MKPMTEQRRQELIAVAQKRIKHYQAMKQSQDSATVRPRGGVDFDYQVSIDLMQVALASLTAEHAATVLVRIRNKSLHSRHTEWHIPFSESKTLELYTAPPVPVIKLPSVQDLIDEYKYQASPHDIRIWNFSLSVINRLNGMGE